MLARLFLISTANFWFCVSIRARVANKQTTFVHVAGRIGCVIDMALETHTTNIMDIDWDTFDCMKRSESGNSGGVYFVQTRTRVVVVKPGFGPGDAAAFALSPVPHPKYRIVSPAIEADWAHLKRAFNVNNWTADFWSASDYLKQQDWKKYFAPETAHSRVTNPVLMELVVSAPGVRNLAQLFTPDAYCEGVVEGGCLCPASYERSLTKSDTYENCDACFRALEQHFKASPQPYNLADLLQKRYPEEVCSLAAFDAFILEYDQLPDLRNSPFSWNGENVLLSPEGHLINIDAGVLHNTFTQKAIDLPESGLDQFGDFFTDRESEYHSRMRGQLLTMLLFPTLDHSGGQSEAKLSTCGISQRNVTHFFKHPLPGQPSTEEERETLWRRCKASIQEEFTRLAGVSLELSYHAAGAWDWQKCEGEWCFNKEGLFDFLRRRQGLLRKALQKWITGSTAVSDRVVRAS